jgi:hypothetical protein
MKFLIGYTGVAEQRTLTYDVEECSFDIEPIVQEIEFDIVLNKLNLTVTNNGKVVQVWGFSGYNEWVKSDCSVPQSKKGTLNVIDNLEYGLSYRIQQEDFPVYVNSQTGWVCIGNPKKTGQAVEFINNCVAVIDSNQEFVSLWLKPQSLPEF